MKQLLTFICLATIIHITGCTKENNQTNTTFNSSIQIDSLIRYLQKEIPADISKLDLTSINKVMNNNQVIAFQIFEKSSDKKFLILRKDSQNYAGNWVDLSGLSKDQNLRFSGKLLLKNLNGKTKTELSVENNKLTRRENSGNKILLFSSPNILRRDDIKILPEIVIFMSDRNTYLNLSWLFDGDSYYYNTFTQITNIGSGGGGSSNSSQKNQNIEAIALPVFTGPKTPIKNLKEELKCFSVKPLSTYTISVRVNQPVPGSSDKVNLGADFIVGHTFLSLEQVNKDGSKISRNIGFFPENEVYPGNTQDASVFGDDSNTPFAVSLNIAVSGTEFNTVINTLLTQQSKLYDLNNFNCINSTASALESIGIHLPLNSSGIKYLFKGYSPGELGQDIRNMDLKKFMENNGNKPMSIVAQDKNQLLPKPRAGTCD